MHRPSLNFQTLLKSSLAALVIAAGLCSPVRSALAIGCGGGAVTDDAGNPCPSPSTAPAAASTAGTVSNTNLIFSYFAAMAMGIAELVGKLVITVLDVTIPVMQYQGFASSPVVRSGWAIVRDVVNMFFVVILIVIAMGTIFGSSKFQWKQQVPKLMIFALVINFSRTLCGLMIDFSQVIMLTFANALKDIAGGNFIQLLGLGDMFSLSEHADQVIDAAGGGVAGTSAFDLFAAGAAAVIMMVWVLAVVLVLLCVLVYRIVMLWILIVISPLAWFTAAVPFDQAKGSYSEWWKNFICYCSVGPIITFFLWLTLAVAGSGFIASTDSGFTAIAPQEGGGISAGFITHIFEFQRLLSFVIGMAMLIAGMDAAAKVCAGVKGPGLNKLLSATKGGGFINAFAGGQARKYGGKYGGKMVTAGREKLGGFASEAATGLLVATTTGDVGALGFSKAAQAKRAAGQRKLADKGWMPSEVSDALHSSADARQADLEKKLKDGAGKFKDASSDRKFAYLNKIAKDGRIPVGEESSAMGLMAEAMKDPKMRERLEAAGILEKLYAGGTGKDGKANLGMGDSLKTFLKGTKGMDSIDDFEAGRPDIAGKIGSINSMDDVLKIDPTALARMKDNPAFKAQLEKIKSTVLNPAGTDYLNAYEFFDKGHGGAKKVRAWESGMTGVYEGMSANLLSNVPAKDLAEYISPDLLAKRPDAAGYLSSARRESTRHQMRSNPAMQKDSNVRSLGFQFDASGMQTGVNGSQVFASVKNNPLAVKNTELSDDKTGELAMAIAGAYNDEASLKALLEEYKKASPEDRREMDVSVMENVIQSFESAESGFKTAGKTDLAFEMQGRRTQLITLLERVEGGNAAMKSSLALHQANLSHEETALSSLRRPTTQQTQRLTRIRADIARLGSVVARH